MAQYTFGILILLLFFRGVLGYRELEKGIFIAAGIAIAAAGEIIELCFDAYETNIWMQRLLLVMLSTIPMFIFKGRKIIIFGTGFCVICLVSEITSVIYGLQLVAMGLELIEIGPYFAGIDNYLISGIVCIAALMILMRYVRVRNIQLYSKINEMNGLLFIPAVTIMYITKIGGMYGIRIFSRETALIMGIDTTKNSVLGMLAFALFFLLVVLAYQKKTMKRLLLLSEKCLEDQTAQYKLTMNKDRELRKFRHDYNAHMTAIAGLLAKGEYTKLQEYIRSMGEFRDKFNLVSSGNIVSDAILNQYKELCNREDITFEIAGKFPERFNMAETDLCMMFSNLMSNAYEAALQCEAGSRSIRTEIRNNEENVFLKIVNAVKGEVVFKNGIPVTDKKDRDNHGFGTESILDVIKRNDGYIEWKQPDKGTFVTDIILGVK